MAEAPDVSYAAARQLGMVEDGVVPIEITVLACCEAARFNQMWAST